MKTERLWRMRMASVVRAFGIVAGLAPGAGPAMSQQAQAAGATAPAEAAADSADDAGKLVLELNNAAEAEGGACRMTFVATNRSGTALDAAAWQVAVFDAGGIVRSILVLEFGALSDGKTKVVLFDLPGRACADISRVVVNDVARCHAAGAPEGEVAPQCLDALAPRSRAAVAFGI